MAQRSRAREFVFQFIFRFAQQEENSPKGVDSAAVLPQIPIYKESLGVKFKPDDEEFIRGLVVYFLGNRDEILESIQSKLENWKLSRVGQVETTILVLTISEAQLLKTPIPVLVHEYVELAKRYGREESSRFVHGLMDRLLN